MRFCPPRLCGLRFLLLVSCGLTGMSHAARSFSAEPSPSAELQRVLTFVEKNCTACHNDKDKKADLSLTGFRDEGSIFKGRKIWGQVIEMVEAGEMPPKDKPRPTADETASFLADVKGVFKQAAAHARPDPGRVTVRRLNRFEYNNTIRDLIGVDFNAAEDFPADDIGHGFDNIGDVLTLSPVLMERYLAAAETIMNRAITPNPPKPPNRGVSTQYTEPAGPNVPMKDGHRVVLFKPEGMPIETGPIFTRYKVPADGQYIGQTQVYVETTGTKPVMVALLAGCDASAKTAATDAEAEKIAGAAAKNLRPFMILKTFEITAREAKAGQILKADIPADIGLDKLAVALLKPEEGEPAPTLYVRYMSLDGPLDTRPASHKKLLASDASQPPAARTREVLARFLPRCYRRAVTHEEIERLARIADTSVAGGAKWEEGMQFALMAALCSPKFLFRLEMDDHPESAEPHALDEYQLASRLSYFLWGSMPDDELLALAGKKELAANLESQVRRMLKDERSQALFESFAMQWLQLQRISAFSPDKQLFPEYNEELRADMLAETRELFLHVMREDKSVVELLDCDYTFLNRRLAQHYGIADTAGNMPGKPPVAGGQPFKDDAFVRVSLHDRTRGGLLTMASVLTVTSNPTRTSPVKRGKWVLEQILGAPPPPPPANVPDLAEQKAGELTGTLRQRMEQHRANPACANCHAKMDPLGFAFENFNAIGKFRTQEDKFPIEAAGVLPDGRKFSGPGELKEILKGKKDQFVRCLAEKLLIYALGRGLEYYDEPAIDKIEASTAADDYRFSRLVVEIVKSDPFRMRRGKEPLP